MDSSQGNRFDSHVPSRMPQSPGVNRESAYRHTDDAGARESVFSRLLRIGPQGSLEPGFYSMPGHWIIPGKRLPFSMYRRTGTGEVVLETGPNRIFNPDEHGLLISEERPVFILKKDARQEILLYLDKNIDDLLADARMSPHEKAEIFYHLAYRRLRSAYQNPGSRIALIGVRQVIALMGEQIMNSRETMKQVFSLILDNVGSTPEHPEAAVMHSLNVGILSTFFVMKVLGHLARETLEEVAFGYFFHNIGMMRLPQNVITNEGPLTDTTWSLVRQHPAWGLEILKREHDATREMAHIIMDHHERLDGRGYPRSLKGGDIHFFAKVCAIVDAFAAMISQRTYRHALTVVDALKEIRKKVPNEYDPVIFSKLVMVFLDNDLI